MNFFNTLFIKQDNNNNKTTILFYKIFDIVEHFLGRTIRNKQLNSIKVQLKVYLIQEKKIMFTKIFNGFSSTYLWRTVCIDNRGSYMKPQTSRGWPQNISLDHIHIPQSYHTSPYIAIGHIPAALHATRHRTAHQPIRHSANIAARILVNYIHYTSHRWGCVLPRDHHHHPASDRTLKQTITAQSECALFCCLLITPRIESGAANTLLYNGDGGGDGIATIPSVVLNPRTAFAGNAALLSQQ